MRQGSPWTRMKSFVASVARCRSELAPSPDGLLKRLAAVTGNMGTRRNLPLSRPHKFYGASTSFGTNRMLKHCAPFLTRVFTARRWEFDDGWGNLLIASRCRPWQGWQRRFLAPHQRNQGRALVEARRLVFAYRGAVARQRFAMAGQLLQFRRR